MLVLVVEDNRDLAQNIIEYLEYHDIECDWANRGDQGLTLATEHKFDAIILDLNLPKMDGTDVCMALKQQQNTTPILMLTARTSLENKLEGFAAGADDYLVKPFDLPELYARLKVLFKRRTTANSYLQLADLKVDMNSRRVTRGEVELRLNPIQWRLLIKLMTSAPAVVSREELEAHVWGDDRPSSDALKIHLHNLRTIIDKPFPTQLIHTLRGIGVVIRDEEQ